MIGFLPRQRDRKGLLATLPGYHMRQRLMSRAPWNKLRTGGALVPERWLSFSGQVAQSGPEYSIKECAGVLAILHELRVAILVGPAVAILAGR